MTGDAEAPVAVGVIDAVVAGGRRTRYELHIRAYAKRFGLHLAETMIFHEDEHDILPPLVAVRDRTGATVVIAPGLRHLRDVARYVTAFADLHTIGPRRVYRRGHRWT